jgi:hypothetical protein
VWVFLLGLVVLVRVNWLKPLLWEEVGAHAVF